MTPIVGDLIRVLSKQKPHVGCFVLRVQGSDPTNTFMLGVNRYELELCVALYPDPRFARVDVLSTNWALRALACVYVALRAQQMVLDGLAEQAGSAWYEETVVVDEEAA